MKKAFVVMAVLALVAPAMAAQELRISIGLRETNAGGGADGNVGDNGGSSGGIEFVNMDGATLVLDGTWQQFTFTLSTATFTAFAGATANGTLDGNYGVLEHIRIREGVGGTTGPVSIWIDDVTNTYDPTGPAPPTSVLIANGFESATPPVETLFQEPGFSGSTSANIKPAPAPNVSTADNTVAHTGSLSGRSDWEYLDNTDTRWIRLTTAGAGATPTFPNPRVRFDQASVVSFWMRGVPEPTSLTILGAAAVGMLAKRRRQR